MTEFIPSMKIRQRHLANAVSGFFWYVQRILAIFGLHSQIKFWGVVYDSATKQPLDPVVVKLVYLKGEKTQTAITNLQGHYGFLAEPGSFKILVRKTNYEFPSKLVTGSSDGIYENLYHGEEFRLAEGAEVLAPNIPMDALQADWNQQEKRKLLSSYPYLARLALAVAQIIFWAAFVMVMVLAASFFPKIPGYYLVILGSYAVCFLLALVLPRPKLWGMLENRLADPNVAGFSLQLESPRLAQTVLGHALARPDGRFLLQGTPEQYILRVEAQDKDGRALYAGTSRIRMPFRGILNKSFIVSKA